ncbi:hypothetical protein ACIHCX_05700 [Streptomyces sp. NPDC052043]|uniref:hypothetical protein n=1 Tax=Streptomyces sp. NPDC052043 TaxID=3365684 RepID=UPI0037D9796D
MSNPCPKDGPETAWQRSAERKKEGRSTRGFGGLLAVVVIGAAVSGCGSDDKSDKADSAASAPASPSAKASEEAPAATHAADPAPTQKAEPTTVLTLTGSGTKDTKAFKVGEEWTLSYTFDCTKAMAAVGGKGNFIVFDKEDKLVNELDKTGKGSSTQHTSGTRRLQIISECDWSAKVTT